MQYPGLMPYESNSAKIGCVVLAPGVSKVSGRKKENKKPRERREWYFTHVPRILTRGVISPTYIDHARFCVDWFRRFRVLTRRISYSVVKLMNFKCPGINHYIHTLAHHTAIWKTVKSPWLRNRFSNFDVTWHADAEPNSNAASGGPSHKPNGPSRWWSMDMWFLR